MEHAATKKITMPKPVVELDGDEMTRILWALIKQKLLSPYIELNLEYYDLGLENRERTKDAVTVEAANAIMRHGVGVKCATITANEARKQEYKLSALYPSPNGTIRAILDGTVFRKPVYTACVKPSVKSWKKPIIIARHAYGDVYKSAELLIPGPGKLELVFTPDGMADKPLRIDVANMKGAGIAQAMHNLDSSIESFARSCFLLARSEKLPLLFGAKDTISKLYDGRFKQIFSGIHAEFSDVDYSYTLIDDAVAKIMKTEGGVIWACKNYDGDVMSDMVASASGSLAMMTSVLVSPSGVYEFEAAHGTVQRHYYRFLRGEKPGTNPAALIFAWTGALAKRASIDGLEALAGFAARLEAATLECIEQGIQTADIAAVSEPAPVKTVNSWQFIDAIAARLDSGAAVNQAAPQPKNPQNAPDSGAAANAPGSKQDL
ncbi:MAG: NADP-dependent isocitrate dehydrogenase [Spirochaetaceae bacterium]|jgi:isocitrate dehydrogenase|nr:NADP-dependent isocitrate dehydrogenase [Spirochaetaceae bacterium]